MTSDFVHLHTHSDNSPLDGKPSVESMVVTAVADHQRAIAITDHGNNAGSLALAKAAQVAGIKAIGGQEMYLAVGSRFEENRFTSVDEFEGSKARPYYHLTVLTKSAAGWSNLMAINNAAMHTVLYKPRADYDLLRAHGDGLILGTGCLGGPVAQELLNGDPDTAMARARTAVEELLSVVGGEKERLFVEVMNHAIPAEAKIINGLASLADYYGLRIVATNDAHFTTADQKEDHDRLLAIGVNKQFNDPDRFRFKGDLSYWMKTEAQMRETFPATIGGQDVISNSVAIAEMVEGDLIDFMPENRPRLPKFPVPASTVEAFKSGAVGANMCATPTEYMMFLKVFNGAVRRFGLPLSQEVRDRLRFELNVINGFGFCDYFLVISELTDWCRSLGKVMGPGRGSAAGSLVSFCLQITDIDPLKHNLLFERFLDVFRKDPPDIDLDFPASMEQQVYEHFVQLWGVECVARIGTFSTKQARAILGDIGRLSGAASEGIKLKASLPARNTNKIKLAEYLNPGAITDEKRSELARVEGAELRKLVGATATPLYRQITEQALRLEGVRSGFGIHACGIVVSDEPLTRLVPMRIDPKTGQQVTLWAAPELESLGFIKMDALTIDNLDVIVACLAGIKEGTGEDIDVAYGKLPMDGATDRRAAAAWDLIGRGDTSGLFQIEGGGITKVAMDVAPSALDDLSAVVALYRPGPMKAGMPARFAARKNGREEATYDYLTTVPSEAAALATVLDKSYGVIVVQEDLMNLSRVVAGFGPGHRNALRRAIGKKKKDALAALYKDFMAGATKATVKVEDPDIDSEESIVFCEETAQRLWETFEASGDYLFNSSHSAPYAYLSYIEAYLKANWPAYFGSALLGEKDEIVDRLGVLSSLKRSGVTVLGPDICASGVGTITVDTTTIRLGLSEIRGVRTNAEAIVAERDANGPFVGLHDLVTRVRQETTTKKNVRDEEGNIISTTEEEGVSDLSISAVETLIDSGACDSFGSPRAGMAICARALRHAPDVEIPDIEYGATERAVRERRGLGIVISTHPVQLLQEGRAVDRNLPVPFKISTLVAGRTGVNIDAVVAFCKTKRGQTGKMRAHLVLEDQSGAVDAIMWSQALSNFENSVGRPPREGDLVNVAVLVKSMLAVPVDGDDGDMGDSDVDQPERLEVVVSTMTLYQDLGNDDSLTGSAVVAHPLNLVVTLPQPMLPQPDAVAQRPAEPVVALVEQPESASVTGELAVSRDLWNIAGRRLSAAVRERTELPLSQITALVAQVKGAVKAAGTPVSVDGFTLRCEATDMSVKSVS